MSQEFSGVAKVTARIDDTEVTFDLPTDGDSILNAALNIGVDAPYSCKGGICTSCRAKVLEGTVKMNVNYALTDKELKQGYILACQSHPTSEVVKITWDE
jgi:ring-1,2-phenylacetyl-CoA epoxidase subunit PaaE